jgi:copper chaperone
LTSVPTYPPGVLWGEQSTSEEDRVSETMEYTVPAMHCAHCTAAVTEELEVVEGVEGVVVDLETKRVTVTGSGLDDGALRAAIEEAGYEAA